ncbi:MAG: Sensor protein [Candidatus Saccharibacteria bacterium]|nr:Sensor protein [Candidatus Saccharibacteria bacterium]MDB5180467.1 Sensor protein [Candidatus Saccharibacteria bacterium]
MSKQAVTNSMSSLQMRHEETLVELELYKLLVDNVQDYAIFFMDAGGYIQTWNKGAQKNKGYAASEIIGKHFSTFYLQKDKDKNKPELELKLARQYGRVEDEDWRVRKDGTKFWANVIITSLYDASGTLIGYAKVTRDLSDRKKYEDGLRKNNTLLKKQRQELQLLNVSKDEFISLASHQLRTPATGVKQYIGMLVEGFTGPLEPNQLTLLEKAYESNERQLRIISDLLKVAQVDAGKIKPVKTTTDVYELVCSIINEQQDTFTERYQTVVCEKPKSSIKAKIDSNLIRMVLENIINNASKYSHEHKAITVTINQVDNRVLISVKDEGVGIKEADRHHLFQKFSRIDNDLSTHVGGSGLGLYWAKKIVDLHNGKITAMSEHNKGTTFTVELPI